MHCQIWQSFLCSTNGEWCQKRYTHASKRKRWAQSLNNEYTFYDIFIRLFFSTWIRFHQRISKINLIFCFRHIECRRGKTHLPIVQLAQTERRRLNCCQREWCGVSSICANAIHAKPMKILKLSFVFPLIFFYFFALLKSEFSLLFFVRFYIRC